MLCNYLNNIYNDHIHPNLLGDEYEYSAEYSETFLDLWFSVTTTKTHIDYPYSTFYFKDDNILFQQSIYKNCDNIDNYISFNYTKVVLPFLMKYGKTTYVNMDKIIINILKYKLKIPLTQNSYIFIYKVEDIEDLFNNII